MAQEISTRYISEELSPFSLASDGDSLLITVREV